MPRAKQEQFANALLALKEGKDDPILEILRARKFVVASDEKYDTTRRIAHQLKMF
jgi:ABC-type phosphate/phosphonate transport system substrate-binding protein